MALHCLSVSFSPCVVYVLAGKPNSKHDSADGMEDGELAAPLFSTQIGFSFNP